MLEVNLDPRIAFAQARWDGMTAEERGATILAAIAATSSSKTRLAERLNLTWQSVHAWTIGKSDIDWSRWISVTAVLGLPETWEPTPAQFAAGQRLGRSRPKE